MQFSRPEKGGSPTHPTARLLLVLPVSGFEVQLWIAQTRIPLSYHPINRENLGVATLRATKEGASEEPELEPPGALQHQSETGTIREHE